MKVFFVSIAGTICIAVTLGLLIMGGMINVSPVLDGHKMPIRNRCCPTPSLLYFAMNLNSTSTDHLIQFNARQGQNIILAVETKTDTKALPWIISISPRVGFPNTSGINWNPQSQQVDNTSSTVLFRISVGSNVTPGRYAMEVDADTMSESYKPFGWVGYFDLVVYPNIGTGTMDEAENTPPTQSTNYGTAQLCESHIENQTVFAGGAGAVSCEVSSYFMPTQIINYTGFSSVSNQLDSSSLVGPDTYDNNVIQEELDVSGNKRAVGNFVLEPGHNGTITYVITGHARKCSGSCPSNTFLDTRNDVVNHVEIYRHENDRLVYSHNGIVVSYYPKSETIINNKSVIVKATITVSSDAERGTYWVILAPGNCVGGPLLLLTVSDCPSSGVHK